MSWSLTAALGCLGAGGTILLWRWRSDRRLIAPTAPAVVTHTSRPGRVRPANQLPILSASELVERTGTAGAIEKIRSTLGYTTANYQRDVAALLGNVAEFVQLLPGSESHHHAQPGGLLVHLMDVACNALALREAYKLPQGASTEDQNRLGPVWSYGILVTALLHDIGKPVSDVLVQLYGDDVHHALGPWSGLAGSMCDARERSGASHYTVEFPEPDQRNYQAHQKLPLALLHALVPRTSMLWLSSDPALIGALVACLEGAGADSGSAAPGSNLLSTIVAKADGLSVAKNLRGGSRVRFATARQAPLIERLMRGLRTLVGEGLVAMNRPGAGAFVDPDGQHIWMVAGVVANETRKVLEQREEKSAGAAGIPTDNTRLFDTWSEYGVLVQPPTEFGKGSVWWVRLQSEDWSQVLTCLKFPMDKLYAAGAVRPSPFRGSVTPVDPKTSKAAVPGADTALAAVLEASSMDAGATPLTELQPESETVVETGIPGDGQATGKDASEIAAPRPRGVFATLGDEAGDDWGVVAMPNDDTSHAAPELPVASMGNTATGSAVISTGDALPQPDSEFLDDTETTNAVAVPARPTRAVQALPTGPKAVYRSGGAKPRPNADRFMAWVQQALGTGELNYNESDAVVHFVAEGMLLVTPRIFKRYLETCAYEGDLGNSKDALRALQQDVQKAGYISAHTTDKTNFHYWRVKKLDGAESDAVITTYLVPNPQSFIRPVPAPNELLQRADKPPARTKHDRAPYPDPGSTTNPPGNFL